MGQDRRISPGLRGCLYLACAAFVICSFAAAVSGSSIDRCARTKPDIDGIVVPPNIAPLNFVILEAGDRYKVRLHGAGGKDIEISAKQASIEIPARKWKALLGANRGGKVL